MTPTEIDDDVKELISNINPGSTPVYLIVEPESFSQVKECFPTVEEKIKRDGGSSVIGWQIWKTDFLVEAEFHAVWKSPQGELKDITPKQVPVSTILFLPDSKMSYTGEQVDNKRINISGNELVDDLIEIMEAIFKINNKGERAFQNQIELSKEESISLETLSKIGRAHV